MKPRWRRTMAFLLAAAMVFSLFGGPVYAAAAGWVCVCDGDPCTAEVFNKNCPVCGVEGADLTQCAQYVAPAAQSEAHQGEDDPTQESGAPAEVTTAATQETTETTQESTAATQETTGATQETTEATEETTEATEETTEATEETTEATEETTEPTEETTEPTLPACICAGLPKCAEGAVNAECALCAEDPAGCLGEDPELPRVILGWEWVDPEEFLTLDEERGVWVLALPGVSLEYQADLDTLTQMLPGSLRAVLEEGVEELPLSGWMCETYQQDGEGNWPLTGNYIFIPELPEGYVLSDQAAALEVTVELGGAALFTDATAVHYLDEYGAEKTCDTATFVESDTTSWADGWYYVKDSTEITGRITATGNVRLILGDNAVLTASNGISVTGSDSLTIYAQSRGGQMGSLTAKNNNINNYYAAIGGIEYVATGTITINGGNVTASSNNYGAAIGGGDGEAGGTITINGGTVIATSSTGAAIGGGNRGAGGTITISGGNVTASSNGSGAAIGGSTGKAGGTITINGGNVTATSNGNGAGIGSGYDGAGGTITIRGGTVTATNNTHGAAIGGGKGGAGGEITISGGDVNATSKWGAGIGDGPYFYGAGGTFSTGYDGNAFINASSISDSGEEKRKSWSGIIFEGSKGKVYGDQTLTTDLTIPADTTLTIGNGTTLTVNGSATLTNRGTIDIQGTIDNQGIIANAGTIGSSNGGYIINQTGILTGTPPTSPVLGKESAVTVSFQDSDGNALASNTAQYFETITITATAAEDTTGTRARRAVLNDVDFYLGDVESGKLLGSVEVVDNIAELTVTLSGDDWTIGAHTITADFGGATPLMPNVGTATLTVEKTEQTAEKVAVSSKTATYGSAAPTITPVSVEENANVTYSVVTAADASGANSDVASLSGTDIILNKAGDFYVKAVIGETAHYNSKIIYSDKITVNKGESSFAVITKNGTNATKEFTYGDTITIEVSGIQAKTQTHARTMAQNMVYLFAADPGENPDADAAIASAAVTGDSATLTYATAGNKILTGTQTLYVAYGGSDGLFSSVQGVEITLKGESSFAVTTKNGSNATKEFTYGDTITVEVSGIQAKTQTRARTMAQNMVYLFAADPGENPDADAAIASAAVTGDSATLTYATTGRKILTGTRTLYVAYGGSDGLSSSVQEVEITLNPKALTCKVDSSVSKEYDGTSSFTNVVITLDGVVSGDTVTATAIGTATDTSGADTANVGTHTFKILGTILTGGSKGYYSVATSAVGSVTITAKALTIDGLTATDRAYDGTTEVALTGGTLNGAIAGDDVTTTIPTIGTVATADAGDGKAVTATLNALTGNDAGNYTLAAPTGITVNITKAANVTPPTIVPKTYTGQPQTANVRESTFYTVTKNQGGTNVGSYDVVLTLKDSSNYKWSDGDEAAEKTLTFQITAGTNGWKDWLTIEGWIYGETASTPSAASRWGTPVYSYFDSEHNPLTEKPASAGSYFVKATVPADGQNYAEITSPEVGFTIGKGTNTWTETLTIEGWTFGDEAKAPNAKATFGTPVYAYYTNDGTDYTELDDVPTAAGEYFVRATVLADGENYDELVSDYVKFTIAQATNQWTTPPAISDWTFGDTAKTPAGAAQFGAVQFTYCDKDKGELGTAAPTDAGDYFLKAAVAGNDNYTALEVYVPFAIAKADPEVEWPTNLSSDTGAELGTVELTDGFTWEEPTTKIAYGVNEYPMTYTPEDTDNFNVLQMDVEVKGNDVTAPTAEITVSTHKWNSFLNNITFDLFFKATQAVTITASDTQSGLATIQYFVTDTAQTLEQVKTRTSWTTYDKPFNVNPDDTFIVYAKVTDNAGNTLYISSDGLILDVTAPAISGIENGKTYLEQATFTVTDANLNTVTVDGNAVTLTDGKYTIQADNKDHIIAATDKAGNSVAYRITVLEVYTVTYKADGRVVDIQEVPYGQNADAPQVPKKSGYYGRWDHNGKNITGDTVITAKYTKGWGDNPKTGDAIRGVLVVLVVSATALAGIGGYAFWQKKRKR